LFLLHMLAHAKAPSDGGSRIAIIMNGSPLFTGDAGSGESEIRRFVLENDLLEALIALPEQLFYNTGIATYVWAVTNRKTRVRKDLVQLIDASSPAFWTQMHKSLGDKRRQIPIVGPLQRRVRIRLRGPPTPPIETGCDWALRSE
jgi:type I restriction enzyme M protein